MKKDELWVVARRIQAARSGRVTWIAAGVRDRVRVHRGLPGQEAEGEGGQGNWDGIRLEEVHRVLGTEGEGLGGTRGRKMESRTLGRSERTG